MTPGDRRWLRLLTLAGAAAAIVLRLVRLESLPGEMYGDIAIVYEYVERVRGRKWPIDFVLSSGPLYHYLVTPITWVTGLDFDGLKVASVLVSFGVLAVTYGVARQLLDQELAALSLFVAGVSSWLLVFSRLGNSQIVTPLLSLGALALTVRTAVDHRWWIAAAAGATAATGLYEYPQTFGLTPVMLATLAALVLTHVGPTWRDVRNMGAGAGVATLPFVAIALRQRGEFLHGYIGGKAHGTHAWSTLLHNAWRTAGAFIGRGDVVFRSNPSRAPHLDRLSGVLFLVGMVFWLRPARRRWSPALFVPFVLLQVPAMLVLSAPQEVPSASRTLTVAPIAYIFVASGLWWLLELAGRPSWLARGAVALLLVAVLAFNSHRYFHDYADGLPNHNVAFGRHIAEYLHVQPQGTHAYIVGCCWGDWGQPEPKAIRDLGLGPVPAGLIELPADTFDCAALDSLAAPAVLVWAPGRPFPGNVDGCAGRLRPELHTSEGEAMFMASAVDPS